MNQNENLNNGIDDVSQNHCSRVATLNCTVGNLEMGGHLRFFGRIIIIDDVSLNSNPWEGNAPSLGNSWEPGKFKMAAVIMVNYKMCSSLHYIRLGTYFLYVHACFEVRGIQWNRL